MGIVDDILREAQRLAAKRGNTGRTEAELNRVQSVNENKAAKKKKKKKTSTTSKKKEAEKETSAESRRIDKVSKYRGGDNATSVTLPDARFDSLNLRSVRPANRGADTQRTQEERDRRESVIENRMAKDAKKVSDDVRYNPLVRRPVEMHEDTSPEINNFAEAVTRKYFQGFEGALVGHSDQRNAKIAEDYLTGEYNNRYNPLSKAPVNMKVDDPEKVKEAEAKAKAEGYNSLEEWEIAKANEHMSKNDDFYERKAALDADVAKQNYGRLGNTLTEVSEVIGSMTPTIAAGYLGGAVVSALGLTGKAAWLMRGIISGAEIGNRASGQETKYLYDRLVEESRAINGGQQLSIDEYEESIKKASNAAELVGLAEAGTEMLFGGLSFMGKGLLDDVVAKLGWNMLSAETKQVLRVWRETTSGRILSEVIRRSGGAIGEGVEEGIMAIVQPVIETNVADVESKVTLENIAKDFGLGAAVSLVMGVPVTVASSTGVVMDAIAEKKSNKEFINAIKDRADELVKAGVLTKEDYSSTMAEVNDILAGKGSLNVSEAQEEVKITGEALDTVYDSYEEASKAMRAEAKTKANGERVSANYIENGEVKTFTTAVQNGGLALGTSKTAAPEYQKIATAKNVTERSGYQLNVKEEIINEVSLLSKAIGREVEFYRNSDASDHGQMNKKTGKIYVNAESSQSAARSVIAHELTHQMENTAGWSKLVELMKKHYGSSYESRRQERIDAYEAFGKPLKVDETRKTYDEADQELVAMFVEEKLLTDADTIREVVNTDKTLAQKIIAWINKVIQKLAGNKEQKMLVEARDLWNQALQEEQGGAVKAEEKTSESEESVTESYDRYSINVKTYDYAMKRTVEDEAVRQRMKVVMDSLKELSALQGYFNKNRIRNIHNINQYFNDHPDVWQKVIDIQNRSIEAGVIVNMVTPIQDTQSIEGKLVQAGLIGIPIEYVDKPKDSKSEKPYKFAAFQRRLPQFYFDSMNPANREEFRKEFVKAVEHAYEAKMEWENPVKGMEEYLPGKNELKGVVNQAKAGTVESKNLKGVQPALRKAEKTIAALNLNSACPMFSVGNNGCYLDACYLTQMAMGANGVNLFKSAMYSGEILQLSQADIDRINDRGGLRVNGIGDTIVENRGQFYDIIKHSCMRGLKLKIITKQKPTLSILQEIHDAGYDISNATVQPSMDNLWIPATLDDIYGAGVRGTVGIADTVAKGTDSALNAAAEAYDSVFGRATKIVDGVLYRKYGFSPQQIAEMRKEFPDVQVVPRYVVCTAKEIAELALNKDNLFVNNGKLIQTLMHGKVPEGCFSDYEGEIINFGAARHVVEKDPVTGKWDFYGMSVSKKNEHTRITSKTKTPHEKVKEYVEANYTAEEQDIIWTNLKEQMCCQDNEFSDACAGCQSLCAGGCAANQLTPAEEFDKQMRNKLAKDNELKMPGMRMSVGKFSEEDTAKNIKYVSRMNSVTSITGKEFPRVEGANSNDRILGYMDGFDLYNSDVGEIIFNKRSIKSDIGHGIGRLKMASYAAVPYVLNEGKVVTYHENWKGRKYGSAVIVAPVTIGDKPYFEGIVVHLTERDGNRFYLHEVWLEEDKKIEQHRSEPGDSKTVDSGDAILSINNILQQIISVKYGYRTAEDVAHEFMEADPYETRYSIGATKDAEYMEAVRKNDLGTAAELVERAAREAGFDSPKLYHGTRSFGFTELKTSGLEEFDWSPFFATSDPNLAETYSGKTARRQIKGGHPVASNEQKARYIDSLRITFSARRRKINNYLNQPMSVRPTKANLMKNARDELQKMVNAETAQELQRAYNAYMDAVDALERGSLNTTERGLFEFENLNNAYIKLKTALSAENLYITPEGEYVTNDAREEIEGNEVSIASLSDEQLLKEIQKQIDSRYILMPEAERMAMEKKIRYNLNKEVDEIEAYVTRKAHFKFTNKEEEIANRYILSVRKMASAENVTEFDKAREEAENAYFDLDIERNMDFDEMDMFIHPTGSFSEELRDVLNNDVLYFLDEGMWTSYLTPQEARERLKGDEARGIYSFYANTDNLFEIDAQNSAWHRIDGSLIGKEGYAKTRDVALYARENGYDGVIIRNVYDSGGQTEYNEAGDVYIFFNPAEQVKSADTITYDDNGEIIPLDERFNPKNKDIRWSVGSRTKSFERGKKAGIKEQQRKQLQADRQNLSVYDKLSKQRTKDERKDAEATMRMHDKLIEAVRKEEKALSNEDKKKLQKEFKSKEKEWNKEHKRQADAFKKEQRNSKKTLESVLKQAERDRKTYERKLSATEKETMLKKQREVDKARREERIRTAYAEYQRNKKTPSEGTTESLYLKNKNARNLTVEMRREVIAKLVEMGKFVSANDMVVLDENGMEIAARNLNTGKWDISKYRNTYTPPFGLTLLAEKEGIDKDVFYTIFSKISELRTAKDENGTRIYKKKDVVDYIAMLNLTVKQKNFLYFDVAKYPYSNIPTFLAGGSIKEKAGNKRGRIIEALDNIALDMFGGTIYEEEVLSSEGSSRQIRNEDLLSLADIVFGKENSAEKDKFVEYLTSAVIDYAAKMEDIRMIEKTNLLTNKPKDKDSVKAQIIKAYRESKRMFIAEGEAFERMSDILDDTLVTARYYGAKKASAIANEMIYGKNQRDVKGEKKGKSLYEIFKPIFRAGEKAGNDDLMNELTELVNCRHDIYRLRNGKGYTGHSIEECEKIVERISKEHPDLLKTADEIVEYGRNLLRMCVESGRISQADYDYFTTKYPYYVPTFRVRSNEFIDRKGKVVRRDSKIIRTAKGGSEDVLPLFDQFVHRTQEIVKACKKNQLASEMVRHLNAPGMEEFISEVRVSENQENKDQSISDIGNIEDVGIARREEGSGNVIPWYSNGKKYDIVVEDKNLLFGWDRINYRREETSIATALRKLNNIRRGVLTVYNPTFWLTGGSRDIQDMYIYNQHAQRLPKYHMLAIKTMLAGTFGKGENEDRLQEYLSFGMSQASIFEYDNTNAGRRSKKTRTKEIVLKPVEFFEGLNFMAEQTPRLAVYMETYDRLKSKQNKKGGNTYTDEEIKTIASYQASDATLNFGRSGSVVKEMNTYGFTFLNAGVQGMDRLRRTFTQIKDGDRKTAFINLFGLIMKMAIVGVGWNVITDYLYGGDDEWAEAIREFLYGEDADKVKQEYEEMADYQRTNYLLINIGGIWFRIPKGLTASFIYGPVYYGEKVYEDDMDMKELIKAQYDLATETIFFSNPVTNNIAGPFIDVMLRNKDNWGNPIVSEYEDMGENFHYLEYDEETTDLAIAVADTLRFWDLSPKKLDYLIEQYLGSYANILMPFLNKEQNIGENAIGALQSLIGKFYIDPTSSNRLAGDYYDLKEEYENIANANEGDSPYAVAVKFFNEDSEQLKFYRDQIKTIGADTTISRKERLEEIARLREQMNIIYRDGVSGAEAILEYAKEAYTEGADVNALYDSWIKDNMSAEWRVAHFNKTETGKYNKLVNAGCSQETAVKVMDTLSELEPLEGKSSVSDYQQVEAIAKMKLGSKEEEAALSAVFTEKQYAKYTSMTPYGVTAQAWLDFEDALAKADADSDGNGYYNNDEKQAALNSLSYSNAVKAVLWQSKDNKLGSDNYDTAWKSARNPYDSATAAKMIDDYMGKIAGLDAEEEESQYLPVSDDFRISSKFGVDRGDHTHSGIDLALPTGSEIHSVMGGTVSFAGWEGGYGYRVVVDHPDGTQTSYSHLSDIGVKVGDEVDAGTTIALSGNTGNSSGPHLHFEVIEGGKYVDPEIYYDFGNGLRADNGGDYTSYITATSGSNTYGGSSKSSGSSSASSGYSNSRTASVASSRTSTSGSGIVLPGGNSSKPVGRSTSSPTYGSMGITLPKAGSTQTSIAYNKQGTSTQRTGRTDGKGFWNPNILG